MKGKHGVYGKIGGLNKRAGNSHDIFTSYQDLMQHCQNMRTTSGHINSGIELHRSQFNR